jgi:hypothetical protein
MVPDSNIVIIGYEVIARPLFRSEQSGFDFRSCPGLASPLEGDHKHFDVAAVVEIADVNDRGKVVIC